MKTDFIFISGNEQKVAYLRKWLGAPVEHQKIDLDELQSLDPREVAEHKVRQAYQVLQRPVLVDDVSLTFTAMGHLPGTLIKWFLTELGTEGLCKLADGLDSRKAIAAMTYAYFDGTEPHFFTAEIPGTVAPRPRVSDVSGWNLSNSWNSVFIPDGCTKTYGEMTDDELRPVSHRAQAVEKLRTFLEIV
jgi:inosine triphosphate pyrophosphatase